MSFTRTQAAAGLAEGDYSILVGSVKAVHVGFKDPSILVTADEVGGSSSPPTPGSFRIFTLDDEAYRHLMAYSACLICAKRPFTCTSYC